MGLVQQLGMWDLSSFSWTEQKCKRHWSSAAFKVCGKTDIVQCNIVVVCSASVKYVSAVHHCSGLQKKDRLAPTDRLVQNAHAKQQVYVVCTFAHLHICTFAHLHMCSALQNVQDQWTCVKCLLKCKCAQYLAMNLCTCAPHIALYLKYSAT